MHFCSKCENMYYIRLSDEDNNKLIYYCRNCGNEDTLINSENVCIYKNQIQQTDQGYNHIINNYTKFDPTLPRTKIIKCPNDSCYSDPKIIPEIIYLRYDDTNMKYIYLCSNCDTVWKIDEQI